MERMNEMWVNAVITFVKIIYHCSMNLIKETQMFKHEEGYFVIKLLNREVRDAVLYSGPHLNNGQLVLTFIVKF